MAEEISGTTTTILPPETDKKTVFSHEYVHELREENKGSRLKSQALQKDLDELKSNTEKELKLAEEKVLSAQKAANDRIIRAELKAHAISAGMIDMDGLKLADLSTIKLNDSGEVDGADSLMKALKEAKPYLFKEFKDSSSQHKTPTEKSGAPKSARDMSDDEYKKAKAKLIGR